MTARTLTWSIGLVATTALVIGLALDDGWRGLLIPSALLGLGLSALVGEVASIVAATLQPIRASRPADDRPADGVVEVVAMLGVEAEANPRSPRFRRFLGLLVDPGDAGRDRRLPERRPTLLGRVALISVFVGRDGLAWSDEEIARGHAALEKAGAWIEREAIRLGAPANIALADVYFQVQDDEDDEVEVAFMDEGDDVGPMEANASTKAIVAASRAASALGFADVADWVARVEARVGADARAWLFHLRHSGRSLAIPAAESGIPGVGLAVCYSREDSFPGALRGPGRVDPTTVVHELFHLFGASDKYGVPISSFPPGSVDSRDIMRLDHDRLARMSIAPLTAAEIGWDVIPGSAFSMKKARRPS